MGAAERTGRGSELLDTLEVVERFAAGLAAIMRLAGRRAELAPAFRRHGVAARAGGRRISRRRRGLRPLGRAARCQGLELAAAVGAQPVAGPGRRQHVDRRRTDAGAPQRAQDIRLDHGGRRAARIGRCNADLQPGVRASIKVPDDAEVSTDSTGISGSDDLWRVRRSARASTSGRGVDEIAAASRSCRRYQAAPGMRAMQGLHLGEQVAEVLAVPALLAVPRRTPTGAGRASVARGERLVYTASQAAAAPMAARPIRPPRPSGPSRRRRTVRW